jgi:hypothetical protein
MGLMDQSHLRASKCHHLRIVQRVAALASQLPRKERWVLLLLDGRRSVAQVARLTQRSELDISYTLARPLYLGYIEPVNAMPSV